MSEDSKVRKLFLIADTKKTGAIDFEQLHHVLRNDDGSKFSQGRLFKKFDIL